MDSKKKSISSSTPDELQVVKAAAMAWFHQGSGSEGKSIREFDLMRTRSAPKPSRYKLEALRNNINVHHHEDSDDRSSSECSLSLTQYSIYSSSSDNSLLDRYEIERISKQFDHYIKSSSSNNSNATINTNTKINPKFNYQSYHKRNVSISSKSDDGFTLNNKILKSLRLRNITACGRREDVNTNAIRQRPSTGKTYVR